MISHALGIATTDVIAFQQNLIASAYAHHAMAEIVEARVIAACTQDANSEHNCKKSCTQAAEQPHQSPAPTGSEWIGSAAAETGTRWIWGTAAADIEGSIATTVP
ncbi:MAG TPA: hypothetical protein VM715_21500, partial [Candidatus Acidoferrum sp.]|nr:hypothetical protein [Candidatus Acidoferrum sp.]